MELPVNREAEAAVIGALLIDPGAVERVSEILSEDDFYDLAHRRIYAAILDLYRQGQSADYLAVLDYLDKSGGLTDAGGAEYLAEITTVPPSALHVESYARIVADLALRRRLIRASGQIATMAYKEDVTIDALKQHAEQLLYEAQRGRRQDRTVTLAQAANDFLIKLRNRSAGKGPLVIPTGFRDIDKLIGGFQEGNLIVVAGRPGTGKTTFLLNCAYHAAVNLNKRVLFWSLEMSLPQLTDRLVAITTGIPLDRIRRGSLDDEDLIKLEKVFTKLGHSPIFLEERASLTPREVQTLAAALRKQEGIDIFFIDYLQLMRADDDFKNRNVEIGTITTALKRIAGEIKAPIVVGSQLSRAVEQRMDKRPLLSDLRDSGAIEQDADLVLLLYREEMYNEETPKKGLVEVIVAKHRMGDTGTVTLAFSPHTATFSDIAFD